MTLALVGGCSAAPVEVGPSVPAAAGACVGLLDALPSTVGNAVRRDVAPEAAAAAAWGDPPVVLRCGVAVPDLAGEDCIEVSGVGWVVRENTEDATVFVAFGREPAVEVTVPDDHPGLPTEPLVALVPAVGALPQERLCY